MIKKEEKKKNPTFAKIRNILIGLVVLLVVIKINKTLFFMAIFTITAYIGKYIRGMFGLKLVVLDPLHFSAIMVAKYLGFKEAILLVAINTLIIDFLTFIASDGTFANFFIYSFSSVAAVFLLGNLPVIVFGAAAAIMYSILYYVYRTIVPSQAPFEVVSKCITSFLFTSLYCSFFGPLLGLVMQV